MLMPDVNILVNAHRTEAKGHAKYAKWLVDVINANEPFAISEIVLSGFIRICTNPKIFKPATSIKVVFEFIDSITEQPNCCLFRPGNRHWGIFRELCEQYDVQGKLVADAYHAALAIEYGCEWVSADTDFQIFAKSLRWQYL